jgi:hypothetical protein
VSILEAEGATLVGVVAGVWRAVFFAGIGAGAVTTAGICRVEDMAFAGLCNALSFCAPELAGVGAVTVTVEATIDFITG